MCLATAGMGSRRAARRHDPAAVQFRARQHPQRQVHQGWRHLAGDRTGRQQDHAGREFQAHDGLGGPAWRQATPEQQKRLQEEFKILLVRIYAGALAQVSDQTILIKPLRAAPGDKELVVRTEVRGRGDPIQLDYRLEKTPGEGSGWKIYNLNVLGVWLVETYRSQFAREISNSGIDGLIKVLSDRNKANLAKG
jgi:ABC-type transporter MlaC component